MPMDAHEQDGVGNSDRPATPPRVPPRPHRPHGPPPRLGPNQRPSINNNNNSPLLVPLPSSLAADRPGTQTRRQNVYVDAPRRNGTNGPGTDDVTNGTALVHKNGTNKSSKSGSKSPPKQISANLTRDNHVTVHIAPDLDGRPITHQPQSDMPVKHVNFDSEHSDSVICLKCRKCKCSSCTDSRELPSRWLCGYNISMDSVVEACTCYTCLKGALYHIFKDRELDDDVTAESDPCACCDQRHCCERWCCIGAMSICLPCLCCYVPLKGLVNAITACYNCCHRRGCRCQNERQRRPSGTKRFLLDSSDGSSS